MTNQKSQAKQIFLSGLVIFLPLMVTYLIIAFLVGLVTGPFERFFEALFHEFKIVTHGVWIFSREEVVHGVARTAILILLAVGLVILGHIASWMAIRGLISVSDRVLRSTPFVSKIYSSCKDFTEAIFSPKSGSFSNVVLLPFPSQDTFGVGLATATVHTDIMNPNGEELISVLVPGTPNPTAGFLFFLRKQSLTYLNTPANEAIRYIISCGASLPQIPPKPILPPTSLPEIGLPQEKQK